MNEWALRNAELLEAFKTEQRFGYAGITVVTDRDVFSPQTGISSVMLADELLRFEGDSALDMGTGTLFLALVLRKAGFSQVSAVDNHDAALRCAERNLLRNPDLAPIEIVKSNLFENLGRDESFDLIVFNQPFYPIEGDPIAGLGSDGGAQISTRFLTEARSHLNPDGRVIMPFSDLASSAHDPRTIAIAEGYNVRALRQSLSYGHQHTIYEMTP